MYFTDQAFVLQPWMWPIHFNQALFILPGPIATHIVPPSVSGQKGFMNARARVFALYSLTERLSAYWYSLIRCDWQHLRPSVLKLLSAYSTVEEAGHKYDRSKRVICIRGLKWTWRGNEEAGRERGEQGIKRERRKRRGSGEENGGSLGTGFVMLNCFYLLPCSPALCG